MGSLLKPKNAPFADVVAICVEDVKELITSPESHAHILPYLGGNLPTDDQGRACISTLGHVEGDQFLVVKSPMPNTIEVRPGVSTDPKTALFAVVGATAVLAGQGHTPNFEGLPDDLLTLVTRLGEFQKFSQAKMVAEVLVGHGYNMVAALNGLFVYFSFYGDLPRDGASMSSGCLIGMWYFNRSKLLLKKAAKLK